MTAILAALIAHQRRQSSSFCICGWSGTTSHSGHVADQLQPIIDQAIAAERERIAQVIEADLDAGSWPKILGTGVRDGLARAVRIARQHGTPPDTDDADCVCDYRGTARHECREERP